MELIKHNTTAWQQQVMATLSQCHELDKTDGDIIKAGCMNPIINTYSDDDLRGGIKKLIINIGILYGTPPPLDFELEVMVSAIREIFGNYTIEDIYKAAQLNLSGLFTPKANPYEKISMKFISDLMQGYVPFRNTAHKRLNNFKQEQKTDHQDNTEIGYRNQDYYNTLHKWRKENGRWPEFWNWRAVYKHMEAEGLFTDTPEEREAFRKKIEHSSKSVIKKQKMMSEDSLERMQLGKMLDGNYATNDFYREYVTK